MRKKLSKEWIKYLVHQPESGMGYHRVDVQFEDGSWINNCIVLNSEEIELPQKYAEKRIINIILHK